MSTFHRTLLLALAVVTTSQAEILIYTNRAAFLAAAAGNTSTLTFEGLAPAGSTYYYGATGYTQNGITIQSSGGQLFAMSATTEPQNVYAGLNSGDYMEGTCPDCGGSPSNTTFTLAAGTTAFGIDYRAYNQSATLGGSFDFILLGNTYVVPSPGVSNFAGFISTTDIGTVTVVPLGNNPNTGYDEFFHFDNVTTNTAATPEPASLALCAAGIAGLYFRSRKRPQNGLR